MLRLLLLPLVALLTASSAVASAGGCHSFSGTYVNHPVPCTVPALTCVESVVSGHMAGVNSVTITGFDPATQVFTGTTSSLFENGAVVTATIEGSLATGSVQTWTGGTRQFAHATGTTISDGQGNFTGEYCLGNGEK
jgi:hypothetical protein